MFVWTPPLHMHLLILLALKDTGGQKTKRTQEVLRSARALFSFKIFYKIDTVAFSFVFDKYCPIMY